MQNIYDNPVFFEGYSRLRERAVNANNLFEIPALMALLPQLAGKAVLDLGCGAGDKCAEYVRRGAARVVGIDISEKMLEVAKKENSDPKITYLLMPMEDIGELIKIKHREDAGFRDTLFKYIDDSGMTDVECYKKANISKQTFSKIKGDKTYHPSKETVLCLIIALSLPLKDADRLLNVAGYTFTDYDLTDVIVKCFIELGNYDIFEINETLFQYDRGTLGV